MFRQVIKYRRRISSGIGDVKYLGDYQLINKKAAPILKGSFSTFY